MKKKESKLRPLDYSEMIFIRGGMLDKPKKPKSPDDLIILV